MLKEFDVKDLTIGLYVHDLNESWWQHDFILPRFLIENNELLNKLKNKKGHKVIVDLSKSKGFETKEELEPENIKEIGEIDEGLEQEFVLNLKPKKVKLIDVSFDEELKIATKIVKEAKNAVSKSMAQARSGRVSEIENVQEISEKMVESISRNSGPLLSLASLKTKDDYTFMHSVAVSTFMIALGKKMGLSNSELTHAGTAGLLHDVGKGFIPDAILNKSGKLTDKEFELMKKHPLLGYQILRDSGYDDSAALEVVLHHHERLDGRGYPDKLQAGQITMLARMGAITDVYDAVTSDRSYHKAIPPTAALKLLMNESGNHFDSNIAKTFVNTLGVYPNGSLVKLKSNKLGIVIEQNKDNMLKPKVYVIFSIKANLYIEPYFLKLSDGKDEIVGFEDPYDWKIDVTNYFEQHLK